MCRISYLLEKLFFFKSFQLNSATYSSSFKKGLTRTSNLLQGTLQVFGILIFQRIL